MARSNSAACAFSHLGIVARERVFERIKPTICHRLNGVLPVPPIWTDRGPRRAAKNQENHQWPLRGPAVMLPLFQCSNIGTFIRALVGLDPGSAAIIGLLLATPPISRSRQSDAYLPYRSDPGIYCESAG